MAPYTRPIVLIILLLSFSFPVLEVSASRVCPRYSNVDTQLIHESLQKRESVRRGGMRRDEASTALLTGKKFMVKPSVHRQRKLKPLPGRLCKQWPAKDDRVVNREGGVQQQRSTAFKQRQEVKEEPGLSQSVGRSETPVNNAPGEVSRVLPSPCGSSEETNFHEKVGVYTEPRSAVGSDGIPKLGLGTEALLEPEGRMAPEERGAQLQLEKRQELARQIAAERLKNRDAEDDPPPDPAEERLLDRLSASVAAEELPIDFGHGLHLTAQERDYMDRRVKEELEKIPRMSQAPPSLEGLLFAETFDRPDVFGSWIVSTSYTHPGHWQHQRRLPEAIQGDRGLMTASPVRWTLLNYPKAAFADSGVRGFRHAISTMLPTTARLSSGKPLILQYELQQHNPNFGCGGGYLTFFEADAQSHCHFDESTAYALRFGADQCGYRREIVFKISRSVVHSLYPRLALPFTEKSRLLTLIIKPDGAFNILLDGRTVRKGTVFENMTPPWPRPSSTVNELTTEFPSFNAVGLAFMSIDSGTLVDNIVVSDDIEAVRRFSRQTFWRRAQVEHMVAERALKTRSAVRQEIRSKRHESKLLGAMGKSTGAFHFPAESSGETERIIEDTRNSSSGGRQPEEHWKASPARRNFYRFEACPEAVHIKEAESKSECRTSALSSAGGVDADVVLNTLLLLSAFAAG